MSLPPGHDQDDPERQAARQANLMKDQLRKEVAMWNAARDDGPARPAVDLGVPVTPRPARHPAKPASRAKKPAAAAAPKPAAAGQPFSMSYDGVTDAEHITYMIARGAR